jgi:uncharacterized phage protein gp47/JayE
MPLSIKTFTDFANLIAGKFKKEIPGIDPTIEASLSRASTVSSAAAAVSLQEGAIDVVKQSFLQTADDEFLELIGEPNKTTRFDPQASTGSASVAGVLSEPVPQGTSLIYAGNEYLTLIASSVQEYSGDIDLSFSAGIVTVETELPHTLASGLNVIIAGAVQTDYNGTFEITVLNDTTFIYELTAGSLGTDTGTYSSTYAILAIQSSEKGEIQNIAPGGALSINVTNINDTAYVGAGGIVDGRGTEDIEDYRDRVEENYSITPGIASPPAIKSSAKEIDGNTRVFIIRPVGGVTGGTPGEAGYYPQPGETVIYILRDNDPSIIPTTEKLTQTKDKIISDGHWPTFISDEFLYLIAPILKAIDFNFTAISPNTVTMQNAIRDQLVAFFEDNADIEGTISLIETLDPFLRTVQDPSTGQLLSSFTYTLPPGDITTVSGEIAVRGSVTFV